MEQNLEPIRSKIYEIRGQRVTGIEPAPAHWRYADQDLKSCVLPLHYTRMSLLLVRNWNKPV